MPFQTTRVRRPGILLLIITGLVWGTIGVAARYVYDDSDLNSMEITWLRTGFAGLFCIVAGWFMLGRSLFAVSRSELVASAILGSVVFVYQALYLVGVREAGVSIATLIGVCSLPVLVALLSTIFLGERPTRLVLVAVLVAVVGVALLTISQGGDGGDGLFWLGVAASAASGLGGAIHAVGSQVLMRTINPIQALAIGFPISMLIFSPVMLRGSLDAHVSGSAWLWLVYLGVGTQGLAYLLYVWALKTEPATIAAVITLIEPLFTAVLAYWLFEERLGALGIIGGFIMLAALLLMTLAPASGATDVGGRSPETAPGGI